jgi:uncharacterized protein (DUF58 family)
MSTPARMTTLFENATLARLERLSLAPHRRLTNRSRGEHLAGKGGTSTEFHDYRDYSAGDDVRYVDWNIFARIQRPYLKLYRFEEELHVVTIIDGSSSMRFGQKLERARQLAAALSMMALLRQEKVSLYSCGQNGTAPRQFKPCTGRSNLRKLLRFVESLDSGGDETIDSAVTQVLKYHHGRGIAIVLSDFLTFGDMDTAFNRLFSAGLEVFAIQLLAPEELEPELAGDWRFVDCETSQTLDISSAGDLLDLYHEHLAALQASLDQSCQQRRGRFISVNSQDSLETIVFDSLRRKGWVRG